MLVVRRWLRRCSAARTLAGGSLGGLLLACPSSEGSDRPAPAADLRTSAEQTYCQGGLPSWNERPNGWLLSCKLDDLGLDVQFDRDREVVGMDVVIAGKRMTIVKGPDDGARPRKRGEMIAPADIDFTGAPAIDCPQGTQEQRSLEQDDVGHDPVRTAVAPAARPGPDEPPIYGGLAVDDIDDQRYCLDDRGRLHGPYASYRRSPFRVVQGRYDGGRKVGTWRTIDASGKITRQSYDR